MKFTYIYALVDPRDSSVRYVGKSDHPPQRMAAHLKGEERGKGKKAWLLALKRRGLRPTMIILEQVLSRPAIWRKTERDWIAAFGTQLTNTQRFPRVNGRQFMTVQTYVPKKAHAEAIRMATEAGISVADWLRQLVLRETGVNGRGRKTDKET